MRECDVTSALSYDICPYDNVVPNSTRLSVGVFVIQVIVAVAGPMFVTFRFEMAGATLFTKIVEGPVMTVLPYSSRPTAWTVCGPSVVVRLSKLALHDPAVIGAPKLLPSTLN